MMMENSQASELKRPEINNLQKYMLIAAIVVQAIRFILRTIFVIVTLYMPAIALMVISLFSVAFVIQMYRRGGCSATVLYAVVEAIFATLWWVLILYVFDTNELCREVSGVCKEANS